MEKGPLGGHLRHGHVAHQAQACTQVQKNRPHALVEEQVPGNEQVDHHQLIELALTLFPQMELGEKITDEVTRIDPFQQRDREVRRELVIARQLRYSEWHKKVPFWLATRCVFSSMPDWNLFFSLFHRYWPQGLPLLYTTRLARLVRGIVGASPCGCPISVKLREERKSLGKSREEDKEMLM